VERIRDFVDDFGDMAAEALARAGIARDLPDRVLFGATVAGCALICAARPDTLGPAEGASAAVALYGAWRLGRAAVQRIQRAAFGASAADVEAGRYLDGLSPEARRAVVEFGREFASIVNGAVRTRSGLWLVRREGKAGFQVMDEARFAEFEARVAREGGSLNKVLVEEDKATMLRYVAGKLDGDNARCPAVQVLRGGETVERAYASMGRMLAEPRERGMAAAPAPA
jgi:hypothetical protein